MDSNEDGKDTCFVDKEMKPSEPLVLKKKKPGRPRKKPLKKPLKRNGISENPINKENCMEMIYDMPSVFKRIFTLFKSMAVKEICMEFKEKTIDILTTDHLKKSHIKVVIKCCNINHYYCKESIKSYLNPKNMEKIIQVLDKNYMSIAFVLKTITNRSILNILFKNDIRIDEYREIDLIQASNTAYNVSFDSANYPIKFMLPGKYFKKFINDISSFSDTLTINKIGSSSLTFSYTSKDKTVKSKHIVQSPESIKLVSLVSDDDIFSSSVQIDYIKPLSSSLLSDFVSISADTHKNMIFQVEVDNKTIEILVNTNTVKLK
jgi:hypothetical protein